MNKRAFLSLFQIRYTIKTHLKTQLQAISCEEKFNLFICFVPTSVQLFTPTIETIICAAYKNSFREDEMFHLFVVFALFGHFLSHIWFCVSWLSLCDRIRRHCALCVYSGNCIEEAVHILRNHLLTNRLDPLPPLCIGMAGYCVWENGAHLT